MSTVQAVMDRLRRTWLEPPDYQPAATLLAANITDSATSLILDAFLIAEDEELVRSGAVIEIGSELIRIIGYDQSTRTCTVQRAKYGTTAVAHSTGDFVRLSPSFPTLSIFEAVADSIVTLYPSLFTVRTVNVVPVNYRVAGIDDDLAVDVVRIFAEGENTTNFGVMGEIVDFHEEVGGRAVIAPALPGNCWVTYNRRMGAATATTDTLADLGVEDRWVNIVMAGAAADLYAGRDLPASHTEWAGAVLQTESIEVGTRFQLAAALRAYRGQLLKDAEAEMKAEYRTRVRRRSPFGA